MPTAELGAANSRLQFGHITVNQLAGPALGAVLFAVARPLPFVVMVGCMVVGAATLAPLHLQREVATPATEKMRSEIAAGLRWLWRDARMRILTLTVVLFNVTFGASMSVLVVLARERLGMDDGEGAKGVDAFLYRSPKDQDRS